MSGGENPSDRAAAASPDDCPAGAGGGGSAEMSDPRHGQPGWYGSSNGGDSGGAGLPILQHAGGYPSWYGGGGESVRGGSAFRPHNGYPSYGAGSHGIAAGDQHASGMSRSSSSYGGGGSGTVGAFHLRNGYASYGADGHGIAAADRHAAGTSRSGVSYSGEGSGIMGAFNLHNGYVSYGADEGHAADTSQNGAYYGGSGGDISDGGWYLDGDMNAMDLGAQGYDTVGFFYENGAVGTPLPHADAGMYQPQHPITGYWPGGGSNSVADRHFESFPGNNGNSPFPLPRNPNGMYKPHHHALADHHCHKGTADHNRFVVLHGNGDGRRGEAFPPPSPPRTGARMHVPPHYSQPQRRMEQVNDLVTDTLRAMTIGEDGSGRRRLPGRILNRGQALMLNADPYVGMRLEDVRGSMAGIVRDLPGCQFLERMADDGGVAAARQVLDEVVGLMGHSAGHVLVEKLARYWTDEEIITRVLGLLGAASPAKILAAAKNHAGSNILQTLIGRIGKPEHVESFARTLAGLGESGVLSLIEDMSGSQLILKCLEKFSADRNQFITDVILHFSHRVCIDRHGCHVFNRCIDTAGDDKTRASLIHAVCREALLLTEHGAGNYVVQHVIEAVPEAPWAKDDLHQAFRGRYVSLSRQKASSHVVQRCLEFFSPKQVDQIVCELLNCGWHCSFSDLISDPYANYVLQTAMERTEGQVHRTLINTINSYRDILGVDRFAKQVFQKLHIPKRSLPCR